jgi:hypothetical protein
MDVAPFHQAEHFTRVAAGLERFAIEISFERIDRLPDIANGPIAVVCGMRGLGFGGLFPNSGIRRADHFFAKIHCDQIFLENAVIEHILSGFPEIDDPFA